MLVKRRTLEEDKCATTNMQNGLVFFYFYFSFKERLNFKKSPGGESVKKRGKV